MVKNIFDKIALRTRAGFFIAFFLLLLSYLLTFLSTQRVIKQANRVNYINQTIHDLDKVRTNMTRGSAAYRGFLLNRDPSLLGNYKADMEVADSLLLSLRTRVNDNLAQKENLNQLEKLVDQKSANLDQLIGNIQRGTFDNKIPLEEIRNENILLTNIEELVMKIQSDENNTWQTHGEAVSQYTNLIKVFNIISIILAILFTLFSLLVFNKENREKREEAIKGAEFQKQLETRIKELADLNKELISLRSLEKYAVTGRLARTIAHEVRNPLTNINLSVEQLKMEIPESKMTEMFFSMISRNSERINNLVGDLLNATRVNELKHESVSINQIVENSLEAAADRIELKHISIIKNFDPGMCNISVDVEKIKIAFLNIIVNAIEAMDEKGILKITTLSQEDGCLIKISDNGTGMKKEQIDRLFEPYFTTKEKGNGLGLANSQNIILSHNGSITGESVYGEGTTFIITLNFE